MSTELRIRKVEISAEMLRLLLTDGTTDETSGWRCEQGIPLNSRVISGDYNAPLHILTLHIHSPEFDEISLDDYLLGRIPNHIPVYHTVNRMETAQ